MKGSIVREMNKSKEHDKEYLEREGIIKEKAFKYMNYGSGVFTIVEVINNYRVLLHNHYIHNIYIYIENWIPILLGDVSLVCILYLDLLWN